MGLRAVYWGAVVSTALVGVGSQAEAATAVVSGCSGVSLPPSVVTGILGPAVQGVAAPLENSVNGLLGAVSNVPLIGTLPETVNTNAAGLLADAAAGQPVTLSALTTSGTVVGPADDCVATADQVTLDEEAGIAIGGNSITGLGRNGAAASAGEVGSIALGNNAATSAGAVNAVAIGTGASATARNSVALGAGSTTTADLAAAGFRPGGAAVAGETARGEVSVGQAGGERRITNLAAGAADTDAVNVSQLKAVDGRVTAVDNRVDDLGRQVVTVDNRITAVDNRVSVIDARVSNVAADVSTVKGRVTAIDNRVTNLGDQVVTVDNRVTTVDNRVTAVDARVSNVVNDVSIVKGRVTDLETWSIRYDGADRSRLTLGGMGGTVITNLRAGAINETSTDAVTGAQLSATNQALAELGDLAVVYDVDASGNVANSITLKGGDGAKAVRVRNVARGETGNDAANMEQLREASAESRDYSNQVSQAAYDLSRSYTDGQMAGVSARLDRVNARVDDVEDQARQAAAIGLAAASLRFDDRPGKFSMGVSGGTWRGEGAFATGVGYTNERGRLRVNATASVADGEVGGGAGLSFTFN